MVIKFDLSDIPKDAKILDAACAMFFYHGDTAEAGRPNVCSLFTVSKPWIENEITWKSADDNTPWEYTDPDTKFYSPELQDTAVSPGGGEFNRNHLSVGHYAPLMNWEEYNVTDIVKKMHANEIPNYGFIIKQFLCPKSNDKDDAKVRMNWGKSYYSSQYTEIDKRPKLTVRYESTAIHQKQKARVSLGTLVYAPSSRTLRLLIPDVSIVQVQIHNLKGRQIDNFSCAGNRWHNHTLLSAPGIYFVKVQSPIHNFVESIVVDY